MHLVESFFDVVEADALGDELLERQAPLQVNADQGGEVTLGQAVAVPGLDLREPPREKKSTSGIFQCHRRGGDPD